MHLRIPQDTIYREEIHMQYAVRVAAMKSCRLFHYGRVLKTWHILIMVARAIRHASDEDREHD